MVAITSLFFWAQWDSYFKADLYYLGSDEEKLSKRSLAYFPKGYESGVISRS
jgi:hypothetical protein